ncbi:MAG: hypothetical protein QGI49_04585 [SAR202 cluster bacterium]|nr:hypothetical protein [SAR202 cluster bacterium]
MSKHYSMETIAAAKELHMQGQSFRDIARQISSQTGRKASAALIFTWSERYGWEEERDALEQRALARVAEETAELREDAMVDTIQGQISAYRSLWERGVSELMNLEITRPSDAIAMVDKGVKGERELLSNAVTKQFLIDVAIIIKSEVHNKEILQKIAQGLVELGVKYNMKFNVS